MNNKNMFHKQQKLAANFLKKSQYDIVKAANKRKLKPVFPSATVIASKIKQIEAQEHEKSTYTASYRPKAEPDAEEHRRSRKGI